MRRFLVLAAVGAVASVMLPAAPASATPPLLGIHIVVEVTFDGTSIGGPFTAWGPAVDEGLVCGSGQTLLLFQKVSGSQSDTGFNTQVVYRFTCDHPEGRFPVKLQVRIDWKGDNFNWLIFNGFDAYEGLHGFGSGVGLPCGPDCVLDVYDGKVHIVGY